MHKKTFVIGIFAILSLGMTTLALVFPGQTACALIDLSGLQVLPNGTRVQTSSTETERQAILRLEAQATKRIREVFGPSRAKPMIVFLEDANALFPFRFNDYGSTQFIAARTCVIVGPKGSNLDVVAHELMHAELSERVSPWRRFSEIPTWFDEGVAMQMDHRSRYNMQHTISPDEIAFVQTLKSATQFFVGDDQQLSQHYSFAKAAVAQWLAKIGRKNLYSRLERIRHGEHFETVFGP